MRAKRALTLVATVMFWLSSTLFLISTFMPEDK